MKKINQWVLGIIAMAAAPSPAFAGAISLSNTDIGSSFNVSYDGYTGSGAIDGLASLATFTLTSTTANSFTFDYSVTNSSTAPITDSRISGFGFNTDPTISGASSTGTYDVVALTSNVPNVGTVDVCFKDGGGTSSCAGGGGGGTSIGSTGTGSLTLSFASALTSLSLSDFFVRYQSIAGAGGITSAVGGGTITSSSGGTTSGGSTGGGSTGGTDVPEPGTTALMLLGLGGLFYARRRKSVSI